MLFEGDGDCRKMYRLFLRQAGLPLSVDGVSGGIRRPFVSSRDTCIRCVARMEVPCCAGLENAARAAVQASGKEIPLQVAVFSADGKIL